MSDLYSILKHDKKLKNMITYLEKGKRIQAVWGMVFGDLAKDMSFGYLKKQILYIEVHNYLWTHEIEYFKKELIDKLNNQLNWTQPILDIQVYFKKREKSHQKSIKSAQSTSTKQGGKTIKALIYQENERKLKEGYQLCPECQQMLVKFDKCVFCKTKI